MYLEEQQLDRFLGTGKENADGDTLSAFLHKYDPDRYRNPSNTVDTLVFMYHSEGGRRQISRVLLIQRGNHPNIGWWALPGGFVEYREDIEQAALRELQEETGIADIQAVQLKTYGAYDRDPRTRIITTAYVALVPEGVIPVKAGDDARDSAWFEIRDLLLETADNKEFRTERHRLVLHQPERSVTTDTEVVVTSRRGSILPDRRYQVAKTDLLASDHGAIILEGYHYATGFLNN